MNTPMELVPWQLSLARTTFQALSTVSITAHAEATNRCHHLCPALSAARCGTATGSRARHVPQPDGVPKQPDHPRRLAWLPAGISAGRIQLEEPCKPGTGNGQADGLRRTSPARSIGSRISGQRSGQCEMATAGEDVPCSDPAPRAREPGSRPAACSRDCPQLPLDAGTSVPAAARGWAPSEEGAQHPVLVPAWSPIPLFPHTPGTGHLLLLPSIAERLGKPAGLERHYGCPSRQKTHLIPESRIQPIKRLLDRKIQSSGALCGRSTATAATSGPSQGGSARLCRNTDSTDAQ